MKVHEDGKIHHACTVNATITGRCSHSHPNLSQVPSVKLDDNERPLLGRKGGYGYEFRQLFFVPKTHKLLGVDLSNMEFRCIADTCAEFDDGAMIDLVLSGVDIHQHNYEVCGLPTRAIAKTCIFALLYGAGDWKLGHSAKPLASNIEKEKLGRELRRLLMEGLPALSRAIEKVKREAQKKFIIGLDGRRLPSRSTHSAFNLKIQNMASTVAHRWILLADAACSAAGLERGWDADWVPQIYSHDETQVAIRKGQKRTSIIRKIQLQAAVDAGKFYGLTVPIEAEAKVGLTWAETH